MEGVYFCMFQNQIPSSVFPWSSNQIIYSILVPDNVSNYILLCLWLDWFSRWNCSCTVLRWQAYYSWKPLYSHTMIDQKLIVWEHIAWSLGSIQGWTDWDSLVARVHCQSKHFEVKEMGPERILYWGCSWGQAGEQAPLIEPQKTQMSATQTERKDKDETRLANLNLAISSGCSYFQMGVDLLLACVS